MGDMTETARMRYLHAGDVDAAAMDVDLDGLQILGSDGQKIGHIDGFIIDTNARRATYVVVDAGGWFTSRRLLLPIGHAALSADRRAVQTDVTRDALRRLPEFDEDRFRAFSDDELRAFERNTILACCPDEPLEEISAGSGGYESRRHYREPEWWAQTQYAPERLRPLDSRVFGRASTASPAAGAAPARDTYNRELVVAREEGVGERAGEPSPHPGGRAQPGDVLGIETGGEHTSIGDTAEDENTRREQAEEAARARRGERDPRDR